MLKHYLLLAALLCLSCTTVRAADTQPVHRVFLPAVRDPGRLIIFSTFPLSPGGRSQLLIQHIGSPSATEFKPAVGNSYLSQPSWSLDGGLIAFVAFLEGTQDQLYVAAPDGSRPRLLATLPGPIRAPVWSPDGGRIAFVGTSDTVGLYLINADGTGLRRLTDAPNRHESPAWSPDGRQLAFVRLNTTTSQYELFVLDVESRVERRLDTGEGSMYAPAWSPDGSTIAYVRDSLTIALVEPDGGRMRDLYTLGRSQEVFISQLAWSPDGRHILRLQGGYKRGELALVAADSGANQPVHTFYSVDNPSTVSAFSWGPQ